MADDQFNIKKLYQTRTGGREWYLKDDIEAIMADPLADGDLADDVVSGDNVNGFLVGDNGQVRLSVAATKALVGVSRTDLNHASAKSRGYMVSPDEWDITGLECTARIFCSNHGAEDSRFIIKGPTGSHKSNTVDCSGSSYNIRWFLADTGTRAGKMQSAKEQWHVNYESKPDSPIDSGVGHLFNKWVVCKYIIYREIIQDPQNPSGTIVAIHLKAFTNVNNDGQTFVQTLDVVDAGGWVNGTGALECRGERADEIMTWKAPRIIFRWDGPTIKWKDLSIREIDPTGLISGEPEQPPTSGTISRDFIFKYNLGSFGIDSCGVGQSTPFTTFYEVSDTGSASNLHRERYRVGVLANGSESECVGKKPRQVILLLSKTGNPPSGEVTVVLRKGSDDSVAVTYTYTGGPSLDAASLSTTKTAYTFENLTSNYIWQNGDRLMVEYSGNTVDVANEVNVFRNTLNPFDGNFTCAIKYDSPAAGTSHPPIGYTSPDISRDYGWTIKE